MQSAGFHMRKKDEELLLDFSLRDPRGCPKSPAGYSPFGLEHSGFVSHLI